MKNFKMFTVAALMAFATISMIFTSCKKSEIRTDNSTTSRLNEPNLKYAEDVELTSPITGQSLIATVSANNLSELKGFINSHEIQFETTTIDEIQNTPSVNISNETNIETNASTSKEISSIQIVYHDEEINTPYKINIKKTKDIRWQYFSVNITSKNGIKVTWFDPNKPVLTTGHTIVATWKYRNCRFCGWKTSAYHWMSNGNSVKNIWVSSYRAAIHVNHDYSNYWTYFW